MLKEWECWGERMHGVSFDKYGNLWVASYAETRKKFKTKRQAMDQRRKWIEIWGDPYEKRRKDYSGYENENFKIIGYISDNRSKVLTLNKHTNQYEIHNLQSVKSLETNGKKNEISKTMLISKSNSFKNYTKLHTGKFQSSITIEGKRYYLGNYNTEKEAQAEHMKALKSFLNDGIKPKVVNKNKSGNKFVYFDKHFNKWKFSKAYKNGRTTKYFNTLSEAVTYRNKFLKEHNLPIPD